MVGRRRRGGRCSGVLMEGLGGGLGWGRVCVVFRTPAGAGSARGVCAPRRRQGLLWVRVCGTGVAGCDTGSLGLMLCSSQAAADSQSTWAAADHEGWCPCSVRLCGLVPPASSKPWVSDMASVHPVCMSAQTACGAVPEASDSLGGEGQSGRCVSFHSAARIPLWCRALSETYERKRCTKQKSFK